MVEKYLSILAATALTFTSCIKDDSAGGGDGVSMISLQTPLDSSYTPDQDDTLRISPIMLQSNGRQKLTYKWEINHRLVSSDFALVYPIQSSGTYTGCLRLSNGQDVQIYEFRVNAEYAYAKGVYLLAEDDSKSILSYVPTGDVNKGFHPDVLAPNNLNISFDTPCSAAWNKTIGGQVDSILTITAGNPSILYQPDGYEMSLLFQTPVGEKMIQVAANSNPGAPKVVTVTKNSLYSLDPNTTNLISQTSRLTSAVGSSITLTNSMAPWWRNDLFYAHGDAYFDNAHDSLLTITIENTSVPAEILKGTFIGDTSAGMGSVSKQRNLALVTSQTSTGALYFTYIFPGYYSSSADKRIAANVLYRVTVPSTSGIANGFVVRSTRSKNIVYYTNDSAVYAHNVLANSNFPTAALFTVGGGSEKIVDMVFSDDDSLIYVVTNDTSASMSGSLYYYDTQTDALHWSEQHITERIVKALFRDK